jgi:phage terminase Nu1 subunit (DNA packaging protein)
MNRRNTMPKNSKPADMIPAETMVSLVNCSPSTLSRWVSKGLPCTRERTGHGGARRLLFNREAALRWIVENASLSSAQLARALTTKATPEPTPEQATATPDPDSIDDEGLLPCLERLRKTERQTFLMLQRLKKAGDLGGVRVCGERYVNECRALVALEQAAVSYRERAGQLVNLADVQNTYSKVITGVKNNLLGVPAAVIPLLMPYLRDPANAGDVHRIIDERIRGALRGAAERRGGVEPGKPEPPAPATGKAAAASKTNAKKRG